MVNQMQNSVIPANNYLGNIKRGKNDTSDIVSYNALQRFNSSNMTKEEFFRNEAKRALMIHLLVQLIRAIEASTGKQILPAFVNYDNVDVESLLNKIKSS